MALVVYQGPQSSQEDSLSSLYGGETEQNLSDSTKQGKRFVGLANQGATCYLNGLLQTLFMTPEFRKAIFTWNYDPVKDGEEAFCIPYQLQRLFGLLQLSNQRFAETVPLTKSFGWEGSEVFQQQDVQELTRVLFDALEESFRGTPAEHIIDDLYAGELIDYLRCIDVDYQSERKDKFLDFSLAIQPFGSNTSMHSLTECIEMFLRPELLDGDNQYYAEAVGKKVDAIKGLKFGKLPKLMSVQLKRFVYDFSGAYVVQKKLNDQVKFPMILNMNKYVAKKRIRKSSQPSEEKVPAKDTEITSVDEVTVSLKDGENVPPEVSLDTEQFEEVVNTDFEAFLKHQMEKLRQKVVENSPLTTPMDVPLEEPGAEKCYEDPNVPNLVDLVVYGGPNGSKEKANPKEKSSSISEVEPDHDVVYDSMTREQIDQLIATQGEWVYELYAVLIHSGAISGGHYYAYIKDFSTNQWYNFNDSSVTPIDEKTVQEAWGGTIQRSYSSMTPSTYTGSYYSSMGTSTSSSYQSSANAYMLMYRQVTLPLPTIANELIPSYIHELVAKEQAKLEAKLKEEEELRNRLNLRVQWQGKEQIVRTKRNATYEEFLHSIWEQLMLYQVLDLPISNSSTMMESSESINTGEPDDTKLTGAEEKKAEDTESVNKKLSVANPKECSSPTSSLEIRSDQPLSGKPDTVNIPSPNYELFRIRDYNHYTKVLQGGYDFEKSRKQTLGELNFSDYKVYYLETRTLDQEWEAYYADGFSILLEEFDPVNMSFKESRTVRLPSGATVMDLKEKITKFTSYPLQELRILRFSPLGFHDARMEILEDTKRLREDYYIYDGNKLYCEQATALSTATESLAFDAFVTGRNRVEIRYNAPPSSLYDRTAFVDARWKVQELRAKIAEDLQMDVTKCRLFKLTLKGQELKDGESSLTTCGVYSGMNLAVGYGKATPAGYYSLVVSLYTAVDTVVGVKQLPPLEPIVEEVTGHYSPNHDGLYDENPTKTTTSSSSSIVSEINEDKTTPPPVPPAYKPKNTHGKGDEEEPEMVELQPLKGNRSMAEGEVTTEADDALPKDNYTAWITDERNYPSGGYDPEADIDEGDNLSNKGIADDSWNGEGIDDDFPIEDDDQTPLAYADMVLQTEEFEQRMDPLSATKDTKTGTSNTQYYSLNDVKEMSDRDETKGTNSIVVVENSEVISTTSAPPVVAVAAPGTDDLSSKTSRDENISASNPEETVTSTPANTTSPDQTKKVIDLTNVEPSDFAERMVKNSITLSQFEVIDFPEEIVVQSTTKVEELRAILTTELIKIGKLPEGTSPNRIRIRDRYGINAGKMLRDGKTLQEQQIYLCDNKMIGIQILPEEEQLPENDHGDVIVLLQRWHRSTWSLGERYEVLLPGSYAVREVARGLAAFYSIPTEHLRVLVVPKENTFYLSELAHKAPSRNYGRAWFDPTHEMKLMRYMSHDLRVQDGDLIIVQDESEPLMTLSPADLKSIEIVEAANQISSSSYGSYYYGPSPASTVSPTDYSRYGTGYSTGVGTSPSPYNNSSNTITKPRASQGIKIKTQKDRLKDTNTVTSNSVSGKSETPHDSSSSPGGVAVGEDSIDMEQLKTIEGHIADINRSTGNGTNPGRNSPTNVMIDETEIGGAVNSNSTQTDDLFRMIGDPNHPEYRHFMENGGWEQYDFLQ